MSLNVLLLGPQGAGKGTQAKRISAEYGIPQIASGEILRAEMAAGTDLGRWLVGRGIDTLAVAGYMTHNCVDSTVRHALHAGYRVEVLADAIGAVSYANAAGRADARSIHEAFTVVMQSRFAAVMPVDDWVDAVAGRREPVRDSIYASVRRAREAA